MIRSIDLDAARKRRRVGSRKSPYFLIRDGRDSKGRRATGPMSLQKKVICLDNDHIYQSTRDAAEAHDVARSALIELCLGKNGRKTVGGLRFRYLEDHP